MTPFLALVSREVLRFWRQRWRMGTSLLAPLVILLVLGEGYGALLQAGSQYRRFLLAGMILQAMLYSSTISGSTLIWEREHGVLRVLALAPVHRRTLALGKMGGAALQAFLHGAVFVFAAPLAGVWMRPVTFLAALGATFLLGLALSSMFLAIASWTRTNEDFNAASLFLSIPMLFVSGAHFPVRELKGWLQVLSLANPVTWGVDTLKNLFLGSAAGRWTPDGALGADLAVLVGFTLLCTALSVGAFRTHER